VQEAVEREGHLARGGEAFFGARAQGAAHDGAEGLRGVGHERVDVGELARAHVGEEAMGVRKVGEPGLAEEQFEQDDAEGEDVGAAVDGLTAGLLGGHVAIFALHEAGLGERGRAGVGDAEVAELHGALVREQHVGGRDVAVDDFEGSALVVEALVGVVEGAGELAEQVGDDDGRHGLARALRRREEQTQVGPVDVLHDEQEGRPVGLEAVHLNEVGVVEPHRDPRLVDEHRAEVRVLREVREDALHDEGLFDPFGAARAGEEDLGHAADPEAPRDDVPPEALGVGRRHAAS
jgi:hypothetical protein